MFDIIPLCINQPVRMTLANSYCFVKGKHFGKNKKKKFQFAFDKLTTIHHMMCSWDSQILTKWKQ